MTSAQCLARPGQRRREAEVGGQGKRKRVEEEKYGSRERGEKKKRAKLKAEKQEEKQEEKKKVMQEEKDTKFLNGCNKCGAKVSGKKNICFVCPNFKVFWLCLDCKRSAGAHKRASKGKE